MIVLDTNIVSYLMREDPVVLEWADGFQRRDLTTTAITRAEIRIRIASLPEGVRRNQLAERDQIVVGVPGRLVMTRRPGGRRVSGCRRCR